MPHYGHQSIRNALYRVFVVPNISRPTRRLLLQQRRHISWGSAEEVAATLQNRQKALKSKLKPPPVHPDIITDHACRMFNQVSLIDNDGLHTGVSTRNLVQRLRHDNANCKEMEKKFLVMTRPPVYFEGREPAIDVLRAYQAPAKLIQQVEQLLKNSGREPTPSGPRPPPPPQPVEEPLLRLMTLKELREQRDSKERLDKAAVRREKMEKEIELTWTVDSNDLNTSFKRLKTWLESGIKVSVFIKRKRKRLEPDPDTCVALVEKLREAAFSLPDVVESEVKTRYRNPEEKEEAAQRRKDPMLGLGHEMEFVYKPKDASALSTGKRVDQQVPIPWVIGDRQLAQLTKVISGALKKGKSIQVELRDDESLAKVKGALSREEVLSQVKSACRTSKDAFISNIDGSVEGPMTIEVQSYSPKAKEREIEISHTASAKDVELRLKWIKDWLQSDMKVTVWANAGKSKILEQLKVLGEVEELTHETDGVQYVVTKSLSAPIIIQEAPTRSDIEWKPRFNSAPPQKRNTASSRGHSPMKPVDILKSLDSLLK
ncbi:hypothetical protein BT63DRAFT_424107 [Microthyrium microscopicum]|uniref:Altered inheritance of mitochondria protein 23, mitochondrial n=1 Tax=Microthyrium microscopicum TaxID=703497 RepID=A0A6A6UFC8_9PEZI|nr:hypothetical protein BT63DRAFT_424107 [Microthyrium microscopicum]